MLNLIRFYRIFLFISIIMLGCLASVNPALAAKKKSAETPAPTAPATTAATPATTATTKTTAATTAATTAKTLLVSGTVNFSESTPKYNLSGFLHGLDSVNPPNSLLTPLKPAFWRVAANDTVMYSRAASLGPRMILVVSDAYGYPSNNWGGHGAPWLNNYANWAAVVRQLATQYKGIPAYWDIWNEPDIQSWNTTQFWNGTQAQYFQTFNVAYTVLRQVLGSSAMIGGPSYANYDQPNLIAFLNYCNQNNIQLNYLSWHELGEDDTNIPSIAQHLQYIRSIGPQYPNVKFQNILINESIGPLIQGFPGDILASLYYLELGGANGADKSCWNDSKGANNCYNSSVDGIINPYTNPFTPRAAWWAYKTYADGITSRVSATSSNANLILMASKSPAQVLVAYSGFNENPANVTIHLNSLASLGLTGSSMHVTVSKVPNTGEATVSTLVSGGTFAVPITNGSASVTLFGIQMHEEYVLYLAK